ncbi:hypothetical protein KP509_15G059700 [Ceratopteris richardii]|nr:hypothetical protein KP509_15G059700 [Ceratopteris richardii]
MSSLFRVDQQLAQCVSTETKDSKGDGLPSQIHPEGLSRAELNHPSPTVEDATPKAMEHVVLSAHPRDVDCDIYGTESELDVQACLHQAIRDSHAVRDISSPFIRSQAGVDLCYCSEPAESEVSGVTAEFKAQRFPSPKNNLKENVPVDEILHNVIPAAAMDNHILESEATEVKKYRIEQGNEDSLLSIAIHDVPARCMEKGTKAYETIMVPKAGLQEGMEHETTAECKETCDPKSDLEKVIQVLNCEILTEHEEPKSESSRISELLRLQHDESSSKSFPVDEEVECNKFSETVLQGFEGETAGFPINPVVEANFGELQDKTTSKDEKLVFQNDEFTDMEKNGLLDLRTLDCKQARVHSEEKAGVEKSDQHTFILRDDKREDLLRPVDEMMFMCVENAEFTNGCVEEVGCTKETESMQDDREGHIGFMLQMGMIDETASDGTCGNYDSTGMRELKETEIISLNKELILDEKKDTFNGVKEEGTVSVLSDKFDDFEEKRFGNGMKQNLLERLGYEETLIEHTNYVKMQESHVKIKTFKSVMEASSISYEIHPLSKIKMPVVDSVGDPKWSSFGDDSRTDLLPQLSKSYEVSPLEMSPDEPQEREILVQNYNKGTNHAMLEQNYAEGHDQPKDSSFIKEQEIGDISHEFRKEIHGPTHELKLGEDKEAEWAILDQCSQVPREVVRKGTVQEQRVGMDRLGQCLQECDLTNKMTLEAHTSSDHQNNGGFSRDQTDLHSEVHEVGKETQHGKREPAQTMDIIAVKQVESLHSSSQTNQTAQARGLIYSQELLQCREHSADETGSSIWTDGADSLLDASQKPAEMKRAENPEIVNGAFHPASPTLLVGGPNPESVGP